MWVSGVTISIGVHGLAYSSNQLAYRSTQLATLWTQYATHSNSLADAQQNLEHVKFLLGRAKTGLSTLKLTARGNNKSRVRDVTALVNHAIRATGEDFDSSGDDL